MEWISEQLRHQKEGQFNHDYKRLVLPIQSKDAHAYAIDMQTHMHNLR